MKINCDKSKAISLCRRQNKLILNNKLSDKEIDQVTVRTWVYSSKVI